MPKTLLLWDLDGTLYPDTPQIKQIFESAVCNALRETVHPQLSDHDALHLIKTSRKLFGDSLTGLAKKGFDLGKIHEAHHRHLDHRPIARNDSLAAALANAEKDGIRHAILTHGHSDWAKRVLQQVGIDSFFDDAHIISTEKIDFLKKQNGPDAFERALNILGHTATETIMIEDAVKNLLHPHRMGMGTILIDPKAAYSHATKPDYVGILSPDATQALQVLRQNNYMIAPAAQTIATARP